MEKEIIVENLETNVTRLIVSIESSYKNLSEEQEKTAKEIVESIKAIKIEPTDLSSIVSGIQSIIDKLSELTPKEIEFKDKEILDCLTCIEKCIKEIEIPKFDLSSIQLQLSEVILAIERIKIPENKEVVFPSIYPLPQKQVEELKQKYDEEVREKLSQIIETLLDIRSVTGGGGGPDVVGVKSIIGGKETRISPATEETLLLLKPQASFTQGAKSSISTSSVRMRVSSLPCVHGVMIKADPTNTGIVYIGNSSAVTNGSSDTTDGLTLSANDGVVLKITDANLVWLIASAAGQKVSYLAI